MLLVSGCGSLSRLVGSDGDRTRASATRATPQTRLLATYLVRVDPQAGSMQFTPVSLPTGSGPFASPGKLSDRRRGVRTQATNYGPLDRIALSGVASHSGGELSGNVSISTTGRVTFSDVRAVIASISNSSVTVKNPSGTTTLSGTSRPYYDHGQVAPGAASTRAWSFVNTSAVSFTFRVQIYANVWSFAAADGGPVGGICFLNSTTGWVVGAGGKILKTEDGGATWQAQNSAITRGLSDVFFLDATRGWAVGDSGTILATTNGGRTWEAQTSPVSVNLNAVRFVSATRGWIAGNFDNAVGLPTLLVTTNGGASWARTSATLPGEGVVHLFGMEVTVDGGTQITAVGVDDFGALVLRSNDGGSTWSSQPVPADLDSLHAVDFVSASRGWAVGKLGTILFTNNGGASWSQQTAPVGSANLYDVAFANSNLGWCVGQGGVILKTANGGTSWSTQASTVSSDLQGVAALAGDTNRAWATGAAGVLLVTTNGGTTWTAPSASANASYNAVKFFDPNNGWVVGAGGTMLRTTDGGVTWSRMTGTNKTLADIDFVSPTHGWTVGATSTILRTTNGGTSWSALSLPISVSGAFSGVCFTSTTQGMVVGNGMNGTTPGGVPFNTGLYLRTTDGGATWQVRPTSAESALPPLNAVDFADANTGWIVGSSGQIMKTTNGGVTWGVQASPAGQSLFSVKAIDATHACAVGQSGRIFRTNDGTNWYEQFSGVTVDLNGVDFVDLNRGWAVGATRTVSEGGTPVTRETLLRTTDGGSTWRLVDTYSNLRLNGLCFLNADDGWIVGANGLIKRYR
jgi:photosystem II stability/assembly factor-like uncharacterized protein